MKGHSALFAVVTLTLTAVFVQAGESKYGHFKYPVAKTTDLAEAGRYRKTGRIVKLHKDAARAFKKMAAEAKKKGVGLVPISGFRTLAYQKGLFDRAVKRHGSIEKAAKWSAPPGHSEHHTGYCLDIGDLSAPQADVDETFEYTPAFRWLSRYGADHGFEISFPKDNPQGVSYEAWHWRYVGSPEAQRLFHPRSRPQQEP